MFFSPRSETCRTSQINKKERRRREMTDAQPCGFKRNYQVIPFMENSVYFSWILAGELKVWVLVRGSCKDRLDVKSICISVTLHLIGLLQPQRAKSDRQKQIRLQPHPHSRTWQNHKSIIAAYPTVVKANVRLHTVRLHFNGLCIIAVH